MSLWCLTLTCNHWCLLDCFFSSTACKPTFRNISEMHVILRVNQTFNKTPTELSCPDTWLSPHGFQHCLLLNFKLTQAVWINIYICPFDFLPDGSYHWTLPVVSCSQFDLIYKWMDYNLIRKPIKTNVYLGGITPTLFNTCEHPYR